MRVNGKLWGKFPSSRVVRTLHFHYRGSGSIPSQGTKIPQAAQPKIKGEWLVQLEFSNSVMLAQKNRSKEQC